MKLGLKLSVDLGFIEDLLDDIKKMQTFRLSEDDQRILIDREELGDVLKKHVKAKRLDDRPDDLRPVVTCGECVYRHRGSMFCQGRAPDWFCAAGRRSEQ